MRNGCTHGALWQVARVFRDGVLTGLSDRQMLERFVEQRDERAFEALLVRHGPMVFNVCRQLLRDQVDAEDAYQAVFLVLVQKARSVRVDHSLGPWLYTVASRVAARARANRQRQKAREFSAGEERLDLPTSDSVDRHEIPRIVQEELSRLPERLRAPMILCYLQGMTHDRAALELGCPVGTVRSRLAKARGMLQHRVARRGLTLALPALATVLESNVQAAAIPRSATAALRESVLQFIAQTAAGPGGFGAFVSMDAITKGVLHMLRIKKPAIVVSAMIALGTIGIVIADRAFVAGQTSGSPPPAERVRNDALGPDGRRIRALPESNDQTFAKTYYVGDLVATNNSEPAPVPQITPSQTPLPTHAVQPALDMKPLIRLITSTVAPQTWRVHDDIGMDVTAGASANPSQVGRPVDSKRVGSITPFFLSVSLIIRCTPEIHAQVGSLLKNLREVVETRDRNGRQEPSATSLETAPSRQAPEPPQTVAPAADPNTRMVQLVEELYKEVEKLRKRSD